jgi:GNAT superfamily N-acetyltransferase
MTLLGDAVGPSSFGRVPVRRLEPADWVLLRDTRLAALSDSPAAFTSTHATESANPVERWKAWTQRTAWFVAISDELGIGLAAGTRGRLAPEESGPHVRQLISMWVAPQFRGSGAAEALVEAVRGWAESDGGRVLALGVMEGNGRARRFYERVGFKATGRTIPSESDPAARIHELEMRIALD